jgi:CubicO group peptidase (beta-lactamase class C family)
LIRELVLEPLGMQHSFFFANEAITYRTAVGHEAIFKKPRTPKVVRPWPIARSGNAVGGLNCTILDLLRYARFHMGDGKKGVNSNPKRLADATPVVDAANGEQLGISWFLRDVDGVRILRHGGATNGQMATLIIVPERQFALAMLTNSDRPDIYVPLTAVLKKYLGLALPDQPLHATRKEPAVCGGYSAPRRLQPSQGQKAVPGAYPQGRLPLRRLASFAARPHSPGRPVPARWADRTDPPSKGSLGEFCAGRMGRYSISALGAGYIRRNRTRIRTFKIFYRKGTKDAKFRIF